MRCSAPAARASTSASFATMSCAKRFTTPSTSANFCWVSATTVLSCSWSWWTWRLKPVNSTLTLSTIAFIASLAWPIVACNSRPTPVIAVA